MCMRYKFIVCKVLQKEAYFCAARSKNCVDIELMPQGLHEYPDQLRDKVQEVLEQTTDSNGRPYDAMLLGYGLCSNGIVGLRTGTDIVIPRAHDCITLLLGSKEKYKEYFDSHRGVYWYSPGWIEFGTQPGKERYQTLLKEYKERYGDENAEYLIQTERNSMKEYSYAAYVDWGLPGSDEYQRFAKESARFMKWKYDCVKGDPDLVQRLVDGRWNAEDFLIVKPGQTIAEDLTEPGLITAKDLE